MATINANSSSSVMNMSAAVMSPFQDRTPAPTGQWHSQPLHLNMPHHQAQSMPAALNYPHPPPAPIQPQRAQYEGVLDFNYPQPQVQQPPFVPPMMAENTATASLAEYGVARSDGGDWKQNSFYSYRPNEVKHRKRTTRHQLKVLEETFRKTQKPDSNIRKALALQLNMTPRNVQVWFQNRRAKDKTLAKRALKAAEEEQLLGDHAGDALDQAAATSGPAQFIADIHAGSTEPLVNSAELGGKIDSFSTVQPIVYHQSPESIQTNEDDHPQVHYTMHNDVADSVPAPQPNSTPAAFSRVSSSSSIASYPSGDMQGHMQSNSAVVQAYPYVEAAVGRDILAPRGSLPLIRPPTLYDHQRSLSAPNFPCNVDSTSNVSLIQGANGNGVHSLYHQQYTTPVFQQSNNSHPPLFHNAYVQPPRVSRVPSGPLPTADFTFGASPRSSPPSATSGELEDDDYSARFTRHNRFYSIARSDTNSSYSQYGSVASVHKGDVSANVNVNRHDEDSLVWLDGRRDSAAHIVDNYNQISGVDGISLYPSPVSQGISPRSTGYSSGSPPSTEPESANSESAIYIAGNSGNWTAGYPSEFTQGIQTPSPPQVKGPNAHDLRDSAVAMGFQHGIYGYPGLGDRQAAPLMNQASQGLPHPSNRMGGSMSDLAAATALPGQFMESHYPYTQNGYESMSTPNYYLQTCP